MNETTMIQLEDQNQDLDLTQIELQAPNKSKQDVAEFLGISVRSVEKMMSESQLPFYRLGTRRVRFRLADVIEWMEEKNKVV